MRAKSFRKIYALMLLILVAPLHAKDLGVVGEVYPIKEIDFLDFISQRLEQMKKNGEWTRIQNQFKANVKKHADRPQPVTNITNTTEIKTRYFDPSITVPYDLYDTTGRIFTYAGTTINPLRFVTIHNSLLFFNADDDRQIQWAKGISKKLGYKVKWVLVNGSISEISKGFRQPIYFDQEGRLTSKFFIQHVPAIVQQDGLRLKISEVLP